jgi:hypothetical protein
MMTDTSFKYSPLGMCQTLCLRLRLPGHCLRTCLLPQQLEQLQRERQAELEASEATLAALKDQVTGVLNRYLSKDIELQTALQEMQALGIELVPLDPQGGRCVSKPHEHPFGLSMSVCLLRCTSTGMRSCHACLHWRWDMPPASRACLHRRCPCAFCLSRCCCRDDSVVEFEVGAWSCL